MKNQLRSLVFGLTLCCTVICSREVPAWPLPPEPFTISRCDQPFLFGFGTQQAAKTDFAAGPDGIHMSATSGQGGAGMAGTFLTDRATKGMR